MDLLIMVCLALLIMLAVQFTRERDSLRITWSEVAKFAAVVIMVLIFRTHIADFLIEAGLKSGPSILPPELATGTWSLGLVFWEDMIFGFPMYLLAKYVRNKWIKWPIIVVMSLVFGLGHLYQGWLVASILTLYPYFISKAYGEKHGFGTVMMCHIMYDSLTAFGMLLMPYLLGTMSYV